jgi:hypothetical protein
VRPMTGGGQLTQDVLEQLVPAASRPGRSPPGILVTAAGLAFAVAGARGGRRLQAARGMLLPRS